MGVVRRQVLRGNKGLGAPCMANSMWLDLVVCVANPAWNDSPGTASTACTGPGSPTQYSAVPTDVDSGQPTVPLCVHAYRPYEPPSPIPMQVLSSSMLSQLGRAVFQTKPRILVCTPSNAACDELLTRVMTDGFCDGAGEVEVVWG